MFTNIRHGKREEKVGVVVCEFGAKGQAAHGDGAETAPFAVGYFKDGIHDAEGFDIASRVDEARIGVDHFGFPGLQQSQDVEDSEEDVGGFKAGDGDGAAEFAGEGDVGIGADYGADMAGGEESVGRGFGIGTDCAKDGGDEKLRDEDADVGESAFFCHEGEHGVGGGGGFEADGEVDDLFVGVFAGDGKGLQGRDDDADVRAAGFGCEQVAAGGGGDAQEIAESRENDV